MRIITWNVNGIRAAIRKGLDEYIERLAPDVLLLQEVRALPEQVAGWQSPNDAPMLWHPAQKKGYSGVATIANNTKEVRRGFGVSVDPDDSEGRVLVTEHDGILIVNTYLPNGTTGTERQSFKEIWMDEYASWLSQYLNSDQPVVVCGDLNIAHTENDIWNPSGNKNNSGFLPNEREWFSQLLDSGWNDVLRQKFGDQKGPYSWWSNRGQAREKDRGWRIDYVLVNAPLKDKVHDVEVVRQGGIDVSDHAPIVVDFIL